MNLEVRDYLESNIIVNANSCIVGVSLTWNLVRQSDILLWQRRISSSISRCMANASNLLMAAQHAILILTPSKVLRRTDRMNEYPQLLQHHKTHFMMFCKASLSFSDCTSVAF